MQMENEIATVSLAVFEAQAERHKSLMRSIMLGWCLSVLSLAAVIIAVTMA